MAPASPALTTPGASGHKGRDLRRQHWLMSVAMCAAGLAAVIAAAFALTGDGAAMGDFGDPAASPLATADSTAPTPSEAPTSEPAPAPVIVPDLAETLIIPALHVRAPVEPVDSRDGQLEIPDNPATVGWWTGSALPGSSSGTVVMVGHVDTAAGGPGALFQLTTLRPGDTITTVLRDHQQLTYTVSARKVYTKATGLPAALFSPTGPPRLVLITCGGPFDKITRSYRDNVVIVAAPTPS